MNRMNKRGMELSINFIVMLVLSLAILGVGVWLFSTIFSIAEDEAARVDDQTIRAIDNQLRDPNSLVAIGINQKKVSPGDSIAFAIGVKNKLDNDVNFYFTVECNAIFTENGDPDPTLTAPNDCSGWTLPQSDIGLIKVTESTNIPIVFNVPKNTLKRLYSFNVKVFNKATSEQYDLTKKVFLDVN